MFYRYGFFLSVLLCFSTISCRYISKKEQSLLGHAIKDISFFPVNGESFHLSDLKDIKAVVIVMREKDCPISEKYGPRLLSLEERYSDKGVKFIYNYVGQVETWKMARKDLDKFQFKGSYFIDRNHKLVKALKVQTTGDVFILDSKMRLVYRGPVDDQFHLLSSAPKAKNNYVQNFLENLILDKEVIPKALNAPGCMISSPPIKKKVYFEDIAFIFKNKCVSCHSSGQTLINFHDYDSIYGRRAMVKYVIEKDIMPIGIISGTAGPWKGDYTLTPLEKQMVLKWLRDDLPYENKDLKLFSFQEKKTIKNPDYVISLDAPVTIPATGYLPYHRMISIPHFKEDKWIKEIEYVVTSKITHHVTLFILDKKYLFKLKNAKSTINKLEEEKLIETWAVGVDYYKLRDGIKIPKNSLLVTRIHYETIGKKMTDFDFKIKIKFYKKPPEYSMVTTRLRDFDFIIPPYSANYETEMRYKIKKDVLLKSMAPHMHLRGKGSSVFVIHPDGKEEEIFKLKFYNFNFQRNYELKNPLLIRKGSIIVCKNYFDNSIDNPINPDPSKSVKHGPYTEDEMTECYNTFMMPKSDEPSLYFEKIKGYNVNIGD